ncbi:unnamed protein product [Penicillium salamii]|uniref:Uncharacterized protein n=1 Tax=Penicillium salamii TaxID=1612424 RepID=A0A9W4J2K7_9EURO|nr:unnamed protein product [Penicillium salamii]CAG8085067.1 unnamed protein product [Penicillium salamii]CAG8135044.1 unnamed protein product [Penicillium salamii]CAG8182240.1 unnamed protein product [Penicillium salamii]CAG8183434.1 unnamed protein product [Penicillium salamii]
METRSSKRKREFSPGTVASSISLPIAVPPLPLAETERGVPHSKTPPSLTKRGERAVYRTGANYPGLYATSSLKYALDYAGPDGVILIFKDVDFRPLVKIDLAGEDWRTTVGYWTGTTISNVSERVPTLWERSDILQGQISVKDLRSKQRVPGPDSQVVGVSYTGLNAFASALHMIIWLDSSH